MNSKTVLIAILSIIFLISMHAQQKKETLNDLIELAQSVSPKIKMLDSKMKVVSSKIEQGTNLPDPILTFGLVNMPTNSFSFTQEPMTGKIAGITQAFPFPGGLAAKSDVFAMDTLIVLQETEDLKNEIRKNVSLLYYELQEVREENGLTNESIKLLKQISEVVKRKYETSEASLQNIIQVEVKITREKDKIEILNGKENGIVKELNALLLRDDNATIITEKIELIDKTIYATKSLIEEANKFRPFLKGVKLSEEKSKLMERSAEYSFYPNFQIGLQYMQRDYSSMTGLNWNDVFSVVVGISIPLDYGGKYSAQLNEAKYLQALYREQYSASIQSLSQSFGSITSKLHELQNREKLISETLLPQAEQELTASLAEYQVGSIDFVNVINSENDIIKIKTDLLKIRTDYAKNISQLEFLVGKNISKSLQIDNGELK